MSQQYIPRAHNKAGIGFVINTPRCNLWFDPGLGKTGMVLSALDALLLAGSNKFPALVLAPKRVARRVWSDECEKWAHLNYLRVSKIVGEPKQRLAALHARADVYTINYENIPWLIEQLGKEWPFKTVVSDESTRLKGFRLRRGGKRAAALSKIAKLTSRWINLTGTPAPNGYQDLWGQMWFIDKGYRLGNSYTAFFKRWFDENPYDQSITPKPHAEKEIAELIADVTMSVKADDCFDLEPILHNPILVTMPAAARAQYNEMEQEYFAEVEAGLVDATNAADKCQKCLQIATGAIYTNKERTQWELLHDEKMDALKDLVEEMNGEPLLVIYWFKHDLVRLKKAFPKGRELKTEKDEDIWNSRQLEVAFVHPDSVGHGLSFQHGGCTMCFFSHWWALESYMQILERLGPVRQKQSGYNRRVVAHYLITEGTLDEDVIDRRNGKKTRMDALRERVRRKRQ